MSFQPALHVDDLPAVGAAQVVIDGQPVAVVRAEDGSLHAIDDTCSHAEVSLAEGDVEDCAIECWLHGSRFDLRTGRPTSLPATRPVAVYPVMVQDDIILIDVAAPLDIDADTSTDTSTSASTTTSKEH